MTAFLLLPRWLGVGRIDVIRAVGALAGAQAGRDYKLGYVIHFASGILFAYVYWLALTMLRLPLEWWTFTLMGFLHGIVVMLLVSIVIMEHHPVARYHDRGPMTGLAQLLAHILYGLVVGLTVQALRF